MNSKQLDQWLAPSQLQKNYWQKPLIMGILNLTPDSFYDGGVYASFDRAYQRFETMIQQGVDIIDIGGESTRPGSKVVSIEEELARIIPLIERVAQRFDVCISIDTYKPEVMKAAISAGAAMINDIYALQKPGALELLSQTKLPVCLMHMQGEPETMQENPDYPQGLMHALKEFFDDRILACEQAGIEKNRIILDPGFGFGKSVEQNLLMMKELSQLKDFNLPLLLGVSRKSTISTVLSKNAKECMVGGIAAALYGADQGVGIIRTHDIEEMNQALVMVEAINNVRQ